MLWLSAVRKEVSMSLQDDILLTVNISLSMKQIAVEVICGDYDLKKTEEVQVKKTGIKIKIRRHIRTEHIIKMY